MARIDAYNRYTDTAPLSDDEVRYLRAMLDDLGWIEQQLMYNLHNSVTHEFTPEEQRNHDITMKVFFDMRNKRTVELEQAFIGFFHRILPELEEVRPNYTPLDNTYEEDL